MMSDLTAVHLPPTATRTPLARLRLVGAILAAAIAMLASGHLVSHAAAADSVRACFSYQGIAITNLSTDLEYYGNGSWRSLQSPGRTGSTGCIYYSVTGSYRNLYLRIRTAGVVPAWNAFLSGASGYYARPGTGYVWLGVSGLGLSRIPAAIPDPPRSGNLTAGWLDAMSSGGYSPSPAMLVARYMDAHGMHGNVVVLDRDYDGVMDGADHYPLNPYLR